jgi:hypothetical protein
MRDFRPPVLAQKNFQKHKAELEPLSLGDKFGEIFRKNIWGSEESASGVGSTIAATEAIRDELVSICEDFHVKSLLDAPCGDYGWMSSARLPLESYTGVDIVPELIERNQGTYSTAGVTFKVRDLTRDPLPQVDLILSRDCLVHLSFENALLVLANFRRSGSRYLLTTTFPEHGQNTDIQDGDWRLLNLQLAPFHFPEPLRIVNERCTEIDGAYSDKSLALWSMESLPRPEPGD